MPRIRSLRPSQLALRCAPRELAFRTTDDLKPVKGLVGQDQATEAMQFGVEVQAEGYNLFVLGPAGYGRH
jgi:predicted ATPase with chaperone activity